MQKWFEGIFDDFENDEIDYGKPIATKLDSEKSSNLFLAFSRGEISESEFDNGLDNCIIREGMTAEEIKQSFPPHYACKDAEYNRAKLIRAIILEEKKLMGKSRPVGNVRHFWYTNLMYTIMKVLKDTNVSSILTTYGKALQDLVRAGKFKYSEINLKSEKSDLCHSIFANSPYPNIIIASEKASYHEDLKRIADIFRVTFISLGGQGSYKVYEDLVNHFMELDIDLNQTFYIYVISDYDPEGIYIQNTTKEHLQRAGVAKVEIKRVYIKEEQISPGMVERFAIPYEWQKGKLKSNRSALTKYNVFGILTGGIYKKADQWIRFRRNGKGYEAPEFKDDSQGYDLYRIELDNFRPESLMELLIDALERDINGVEYFREKAKAYIRTEREYAKENVISSLATSIAKDGIRDYILAEAELEREIQNKHDEFMTGDEDLEEAIEEKYSDLESEIDVELGEIEDEIRDLNERYNYLQRKKSDLNVGRNRLIEFIIDARRARAANVDRIYQEYEEKVEMPISEYIQEKGKELQESFSDKFDDIIEITVNDVDFTSHQKDVFDNARAGADSFEAKLSEYDKRALIERHYNRLDERKKQVDANMPKVVDIPEPVTETSKAVAEIKEELEAIEVAGISADLARLLSELREEYLNE